MRALPWSTGEWSRTDTHRMVVFAMAVVVALASGSNYVSRDAELTYQGYSAYAPQLATKLAISSTQVNLVGVAGNLGMYAMGPIWGSLIDARGQRLPLLCGSICVFIGYFVVHLFFTSTIPIRASTDPAGPPSIFGLFLLCFAMFLSGCGGAAGLSASVNAIAKSFPDATRASASGMVFAGFGLSAFTFSTVGNLLYPGNAGGLLLLLAIGTSVPMFIGSQVIRPVPPGTQSGGGYQPISGSPEVFIDEENTDYLTRTRSTSLDLSRSMSPRACRGSQAGETRNTEVSAANRTKPRSLSSASLSPLDIHMTPYQLLFSNDFRCLFVVLAILCGCGLMYINNVGTVALALARDGQIEVDPKVIGAWQAKQVATISIWNCLGRVLGGVSADFCRSRFGIRRVWFLPLVAALFISAQLSALHTTHVEKLWIVSTNLGLAYGSLFNVVPMLVLEWFGMSHFSQNFGWINVGPVVGGNLFNLLFGRVYDSHAIGRTEPTGSAEASVTELLARALSAEDRHACLLGEECYGTAFRITAFGCFIALCVSLGVGIKRERELAQNRRGIESGSNEVDS